MRTNLALWSNNCTLMTMPSSPDGSLRRCLACGSSRSRILHRIDPYTIVQCTHCLLGWTDGADVEPAEFYDQDYFSGAQDPKGYNNYVSMAAAMERTNRARIRTLQRLVPGAKTLLDVGCGPGFFLKQSAEAGLQATGLEVSAFAAQYGREHLGQRIVNGPLDEAHLAQIGGSFDAITLWDVIEHLPAPDEALRHLADRLEEGGVLSLSTGDVGSLTARFSGRHWHLFNLPEHLWFFTVPALRRLLRRAGLITVRVQREVCWFTAQYLLERLMFCLRSRPV
ncbi:MAG: class I SAM-dependent methyltransferase, partial [Planctomycetota bacterium]